MRTRAVVAAAVLGFSPFVAQGSDAPHNASSMDTSSTADPGIGCRSCHAMHIQGTGPGGLLLSGQPTIYDNCSSCHNSTRYAIASAEKADPGASGSHHAFEVSATNSAHGALPPTNATLLASLQAGTNVECATCHNQHLAGQTGNGASVNTSSPIGTGIGPLIGANNGQLVALSFVGTAPVPKGFLIDLQSPTTFRVSNDGGISWVLTNQAIGADRVIDGTTTATYVKVTFTGTFPVPNQFRFYVSYPFLRVSNVDAAMCNDCHRERVQDHVCVEGGAVVDGNNVSCAPNGLRKFSHPVNVALGTKTGIGDRTTPLDADGSVSPAVDGNPTNDLVLTTVGSKVTCLTCHSPHFADSNSLTNDNP